MTIQLRYLRCLALTDTLPTIPSSLPCPGRQPAHRALASVCCSCSPSGSERMTLQSSYIPLLGVRRHHGP